MSYIQGKNIIIQYKDPEDGVVKAFAAVKSCNVKLGCETIEVSSPTTGQFREFIAGRKSWQITLNSLVTNCTEYTFPKVGQTFLISMNIEGGCAEHHRVSGNAICTEYQVTGTVGNLAQGSFSFQGTGPLE